MAASRTLHHDVKLTWEGYIELDGKRLDLNNGKELTSKTAPLPLRLDVRGVREMKLIVELGSFGDVQAHVNWAKARLIR